MVKNALATWAPPPDPIGELTALPIHIAGLKGRGSERTRRRRRGGKGKKRKRGGEERRGGEGTTQAPDSAIRSTRVPTSPTNCCCTTLTDS